MKQSEHKELIIKDFKERGYTFKKNQMAHYVGNFTILIFLSKQARVLIETSGKSGSHWVTLESTIDSYSDTSADKLLQTFEKYIDKCRQISSGLKLIFS